MLKNDRQFLYPIEGYPNYFVTRDGDIYSNIYHYNRNPYSELRKLKASPDPDGYCHVTLRPNPKTYRTHRLIAQMFIPNPEYKREVNHINGNKLDNRVENLEWATGGENVRHAWRAGLAKPRFGKRIIQYDLHDNFIDEHESIKAASLKTGISAINICKYCKGRIKYAGGFKWRYKI